MTDMTVDQAIHDYIVIRDARSKLKKEWEERDKKYADTLERIESFIERTATELGVESFRTAYGTAFRTTRLQASIADFDKFTEWAVANNQLALLQKRVSTTALKALLDDTGEVPPGLNTMFETSINVRVA